MLTVSFTHPHDPYVARKKYWDLYPEGSLPNIVVPPISYAEQDIHSKRLFDMSDWRNYDLTTQMIADSRRAYAANISYLDDKISELLTTLQECQLDQDTIILFTSDHGDMLGERGLWFKMSFFEGSARVPLMISAPGRFAPALVSSPASTLDVMPTLLDLAGINTGDPGHDLDGRSLLPTLLGETQGTTPICVEYAAEGSIAPMVMVRDGAFKMTRSGDDPDQLFNLANDANEVTNLAGDPDYTLEQQQLDAFIQQKWNLEHYDFDVRRSQSRRLVVYDALRNGHYYPWDFQPLQKASERYMRNHMDLNIVESEARFPKK